MDIEVILGLLIILLTSLLIWFFVIFKWDNCRNFFHRSYTGIDVLFIFLYFFEQFCLVLILKFTNYQSEFVVGIFSLVVVTTASIQNRAWESRLNRISGKVIEQNTIIGNVVEENDKVIKENTKLKNSLEKSKQFINKIYNELEGTVKEISRLKNLLKKKR